MRCAIGVGSLIGLLLVQGCAKPPPLAALDDRRGAVDQLLVAADDEKSLSSQVGALPEVCLDITPRTRLCQWRLGNRQRGWAQLAPAIGTRDPVNLLCELPADGSPRAADSCAVFPRRSNRTLFALTSAAPTKQDGERVRREKAERRARYQQLAQQRLDAAHTAFELSQLVGAAPERCDLVDDLHRGCVWRAGNQTYGHGTLVEIVGAEKRQRMRLECRLPASGAPRVQGSCHVSVDG